MKVLKALLAVFTFLAAALTCALLFVQENLPPRYFQSCSGGHDGAADQTTSAAVH